MKIKNTIACLLLTALAGCSSTSDRPTPVAECKGLSEMISKAIPQEVGSETLAKRLLSPKPGMLDVNKVFNPQTVNEVLGSQVEEQVKPCDAVTNKDHHDNKEYCSINGTTLKMEPERGRLTYLNPNRSFSFEKSVENRLKKEQAVEMSYKYLSNLGVPAKELAKRPEARVMIAAGRDRENKGEAAKRRAEIHVRYPRQVSDIPVFDSDAKLAIDARGNVARMHLVWPAFKLADGLSMKDQYSRDEVVRSVKQLLTPENGCYSISRLHTYVAYAESSQVSYGEVSDEGEDDMSSISYVPSLVIYAIPPEPKEDSGEVSMAGMQFTLPLFSGVSGGDEGKR